MRSQRVVPLGRVPVVAPSAAPRTQYRVRSAPVSTSGHPAMAVTKSPGLTFSNVWVPDGQAMLLATEPTIVESGAPGVGVASMYQSAGVKPPSSHAMLLPAGGAGTKSVVLGHRPAVTAMNVRPTPACAPHLTKCSMLAG